MCQCDVCHSVKYICDDCHFVEYSAECHSVKCHFAEHNSDACHSVKYHFTECYKVARDSVKHCLFADPSQTLSSGLGSTL